MKYKLNASPKPEASTALGPYTGGAITSQAQLVEGLQALPAAEKLLKSFRSHAKLWVDEHGPADVDGRRWGPTDTQREVKCNLSLREMGQLLTDLNIDGEQAAKILNALERRDVGTFKVSQRYGWSK